MTGLMDDVLVEIGRMRAAIMSANDRIRDPDDRQLMRRELLDRIELCERRIKDVFIAVNGS